MTGTKFAFDRFETGVFIAGSGPIGCAFAREILENTEEVEVVMAEIGAKENPIIGAHHKNSVKYQKDIDAFVHVIQGALQPVSLPPSSTYMPTLSEVAWSPKPGDANKLVSSFYNPNQVPELNLPGCAVTRTVGGMATHWTCACPEPSEDERKNTPIPNELPDLLQRAKKLLNVHLNEYECSVRHNIVKAALKKAYPEDGRVQNLPLAVERSKANPELVTWSGSNTVLGHYALGDDSRLRLYPEHKVVKVELSDIPEERAKGVIKGVMVRDLRNHKDIMIVAKKYIIACGSICTPQILWNSDIRHKALGHYLTEQSIAFCQIVLKREFIENVENSPLLSEELREKCRKHMEKFKCDPIHIPFADPEPQVTMPYSVKDGKPWHTQIHRDAFSYGDVGPRADPRLIVDLRFFGRQEVKEENCVTFEKDLTDIYGMPQATFNVQRSADDAKRDHDMMLDMCNAAGALGAFLPGSYPQFMSPGLALHITGTTRLGNDTETSVANQYSQVHGVPDLYVGGNGVIPDSTACNPTLTSIAYAIHAAQHIVAELKKPKA